MLKDLNFTREFACLLPATHTLLKSSNLTVHPSVSRIVLHGSRGLAGGYRPDSDIDLSLLVDSLGFSDRRALEASLQSIFETTMTNWRSSVEADLAIIFDVRDCGLRCFDRTEFDEQTCPQGGVDCFGLYKKQKGFDGLVIGAGVQVKLMYPCLTIWKRE